jgi:hypothetical protein
MDRSNTRAAFGITCAVLLAGSLLALLKGNPATAQSPQREETKQYKVMPTNLGMDLEERLNAMAAKGWSVKQILHSNGATTNWVVYEK